MDQNYFPNSFDEMQIDQAYKELEVNSRLQTGTINCEGENDHLITGNLFKIMSVEQQAQT
jgi:catalase